MTSNHHQHPVMKNQNGNVAVRHPATVGPNMMAPSVDHVELPAGSLGANAAGGITGGLAPSQSAKGAMLGDFQP